MLESSFLIEESGATPVKRTVCCEEKNLNYRELLVNRNLLVIRFISYFSYSIKPAN